MSVTVFQQFRKRYQVKMPPAAQLRPVADVVAPTKDFPFLAPVSTKRWQAAAEPSMAIASKKRIAVVLSGGPAPGGHNVIAGIRQAMDDDAVLIGFLGGPSGILEDRSRTIDQELANGFLHSGGFDMLGSGRTKIETTEQMQRCAEVLRFHRVDALVIIGGDDSNTNAAHLAEYFLETKAPIQVIGIPKTIDNDMKCGSEVPVSFGFNTASRVYAEMISHIARDTLSSKKYYHFVRLMGRAASHITLECALLTQPNMALISEEVAEKNKSLRDIVEDLCQVVIERSKIGKNYGMVLVPEGLIEFIAEFKSLLSELNHVLSQHRKHMETLRSFTEQSEYLHQKLSKDTSYTFASLPIGIQRQMIMERDPHGNVIVSQIETEALLIELMQSRLAELKSEGEFHGKFAFQRHFMGYEGRCAAPTNFDADFCCTLGRTAVQLIEAGLTGYLATVGDLHLPREQWKAGGMPLVAMMTTEKRHGGERSVIRKELLRLDGGAFRYFARHRESWAMKDQYAFVGPIQYFGPPEICDWAPKSLMLEFGGEAE